MATSLPTPIHATPAIISAALSSFANVENPGTDTRTSPNVEQLTNVEVVALFKSAIATEAELTLTQKDEVSGHFATAELSWRKGRANRYETGLALSNLKTACPPKLNLFKKHVCPLLRIPYQTAIDMINDALKQAKARLEASQVFDIDTIPPEVGPSSDPQNEHVEEAARRARENKIARKADIEEAKAQAKRLTELKKTIRRVSTKLDDARLVHECLIRYLLHLEANGPEVPYV